MAKLSLKFDRLDYQETAIDSVVSVFNDVAFGLPIHHAMNPILDRERDTDTLKENIAAIREKNHITHGKVQIGITKNQIFTLDVLMETGTGKTFTFIETIYRLNRDYGLAKFIILVPSNAIRKGTIKNIEITKTYFAKNYENQISLFDYSPKNINRFNRNSNDNISVLVATFQSFNS